MSTTATTTINAASITTSSHKRGQNNSSSTINESSQLKKQLRDATRSLRRQGLPATIQQDLERKVSHLNHLISRRQESESEKALILRYRKVRFFENKKAERYLKQAATKFCASESEETMLAYLKAKKDSIYCLSFPRNQKYISLFASTESDDGSSQKIKESLLEEYSKDLLGEMLDISSALLLAKGDISSLAKKASKASDDEDDEDGDEDDEEEDEDASEEDASEEEEENSDASANEEESDNGNENSASESENEDSNDSDNSGGEESSAADSNDSSSDGSDFDSEDDSAESFLSESDEDSDLGESDNSDVSGEFNTDSTITSEDEEEEEEEDESSDSSSEQPTSKRNRH